MKKVFYFVSACALVVLLAACGGPAADAKKMCSKAEKCASLKDDQEKFQKCQEDFAQFMDEMEKKHEGEEYDDATQKELDEILDGCSEAFLTTLFG